MRRTLAVDEQPRRALGGLLRAGLDAAACLVSAGILRACRLRSCGVALLLVFTLAAPGRAGACCPMTGRGPQAATGAGCCPPALRAPALPDHAPAPCCCKTPCGSANIGAQPVLAPPEPQAPAPTTVDRLAVEHAPAVRVHMPRSGEPRAKGPPGPSPFLKNLSLRI